MMRGKYFRAWDIEAKCYVQKPILVDNFGQVYVVCEEASKEEGTCLITGKPNVIIEQDTGLKDRNGKEIYEGDIIREEIDFDSEMTDGSFKYMVYWDEEELCWCLEHVGNESIHHELWQCNQSTEVIGNIHENPELIEKEK